MRDQKEETRSNAAVPLYIAYSNKPCQGRKKTEMGNVRNSEPHPMHISLYNKLFALVPVNRVSRTARVPQAAV